jgi:hypothetical protein
MRNSAGGVCIWGLFSSNAIDIGAKRPHTKEGQYDLLSQPLINALPDISHEPGCVCDESTQCPRAAKYVEHRTGCVVGDCFPENRTALIPVCQKPTPEIGTFAGPPNCSPSASDQ